MCFFFPLGCSTLYFMSTLPVARVGLGCHALCATNNTIVGWLPPTSIRLLNRDDLPQLYSALCEKNPHAAYSIFSCVWVDKKHQRINVYTGDMFCLKSNFLIYSYCTISLFAYSMTHITLRVLFSWMYFDGIRLFHLHQTQYSALGVVLFCIRNVYHLAPVYRLESSRSYRREVLALNAAASHATGPVDRDSACECDGESSAIYPSTHLESTVIESFQPSCEDTVDTTTSDLDSMALTEEFASKSRHRVGETKRRDSGHDSGGHVSTSDDGLMGRPPSSLPYLPVEMWLLLLKQFQLSDFLSTLRESSGVQSPAFFDSKTTPLWWYSMGWFLDDSIHD